MSKYLIFVDTNILLDFYRSGWESSPTVLERFDTMHDRLITTYQVEMEFKKNRQRVILETLENLKNATKLTPPGFLRETKAIAVLNKSAAESNKRIKKLRTRLTNVLLKPTTHDPVYKVAQRLFRNDSPVNLTRDKPQRRPIKRAAFRRFILGYPPRKDDDLSMGDAFNWEWIVNVAESNPGKHIAIVSRDADYGVRVNDEPRMNDFLLQEFRDRVSKKRHCILFNRLSPAFELAGVRLSAKAKREEKEFARQQSIIAQPGTGYLLWEGSTKTALEELLRRFPQSFIAEPPPLHQRTDEDEQDDS
jgi:hypothetical protein